MNTAVEPIAVEFPLRGEWVAINTPGYKIPSHGTHQWAQTYAYDLLQVDWKRKLFKFYRSSTLAYLFGRVIPQDCYCWSKPIHSPFDGTIVVAEDGWLERNRVHFLWDLSVLLKNGLLFDARKTNDYRPVAGNYLILEGPEAYAFIAHARCGSLRVTVGEKVKTGQVFAEVGNSGNTTTPHLHFHLMDNKDLSEARGLPCCFRQYELFESGRWRTVTNGIPGRSDRIRVL